MSYEIQIERVEPRVIAAVRRRASMQELATVIPQACGEVWEFIRATKIPHVGLNIAVYLDMEMTLECGVIVLQTFAGTGSVICSATPGGRVAAAAHFGPYNRLVDAHRAIRTWCAGHGHAIAGPNWEIYDHWNDDPTKLRTDVFYLLA
jgi:effector-binding domain-containing protein